jgi:hypothetical protein
MVAAGDQGGECLEHSEEFASELQGEAHGGRAYEGRLAA